MSRWNRLRAIACAVVAGGLSCSVLGSPIQASSFSEEVQHRSDTGAYLVSQAQPTTGYRAGYQSGFEFSGGATSPGGIDPVLYFQLPARLTGQTVSGATFTISELKASSGVTPTFNVDLYGLGFDQNDPPANDSPPFGTGGVTSATISPAYFYVGPNQTGATGAGGLPITKVQDNLFTSTDFANATATNSPAESTSGSALATYIESVYDSPSYKPGGYLVLRLTPDDGPSSGTMRYQFPYPSAQQTYDPASFGTVAYPTLDVQFASVPEPAGLGLIAAAAVGFIRRRRGRQS
jgi:hypothetical protein